MAIEADYLIDRRRLKRRLALWQLIGLVAVVAAALALASRVESLSEEPHVARLAVTGLIVDDPDRNEAIDRVAKDERARALIVRIDSPGGTVVGGENLYARLREVAAVKPVVAVIGELGTSAAYMTAIATDRIFARAGSITGSIGVILQTADVTPLLEKIGIKPETVKSSPLKAQPNPLEPFTPAAREAARALIMNMYDSFVAMVGERRHLGKAELAPLADGRAFTGLQAVSNGLIDAIGGEAEARQWLAQTRDIGADLPVRDVEIGSTSQSWFDSAALLFGKSLFSERLTLDGLLSLWQPARS
jgi:protease-4